MANLSEKSRRILQLIADGNTYERILALHSDLTYKDIFHAAEEAIKVADQDSACSRKQPDIRNQYPRAGEKWTEDEEDTLKHLFDRGIPTSEICRRLQRKSGGINSRLRKLGLME